MSLMDAMKNYFSYEVVTMCGIPKVKLLGKIEDWVKLKNLVAKIGIVYEMNFWTSKLLTILEKFVEAYKGKVDKAFWESIYRDYPSAGSGRWFKAGSE